MFLVLQEKDSPCVLPPFMSIRCSKASCNCPVMATSTAWTDLEETGMLSCTNRSRSRHENGIHRAACRLNFRPLSVDAFFCTTSGGLLLVLEIFKIFQRSQLKISRKSLATKVHLFLKQLCSDTMGHTVEL